MFFTSLTNGCPAPYLLKDKFGKKGSYENPDPFPGKIVDENTKMPTTPNKGRKRGKKPGPKWLYRWGWVIWKITEALTNVRDHFGSSPK
ncbi:MAG: hypothetical protein K8S27_16140 [Candidatus Omnitrophica bacterium]|nr:hypothetical protein [Candidatus Omnitrophota bacterium]